MKSFNCSNCGECCGPVPVNKWELNRIKKHLEKLPKSQIERLKNQKRSQFTCIFRDVENNSCGIYKIRPEICKMFGFYEGMVCPRNPEHATIGRKEGQERIGTEETVGILSLQITWDNIMKYSK